MTSSFLDTSNFLDSTPSGAATVSGAIPPPPITHDLFAWYDLNQFNDVLDGQPFTTLPDSKAANLGPAHDAVAPGDAQRPTYHTAVINQPPSAHFGEVPLLNLNDTIAGTGEMTMFFIYKSDEPDPVNTIISSMSADGNHIGYWLTMNEQGQVVYQQGAAKFSGVIRLGHRAYHIFTVRRKSTSDTHDDITLMVDADSEGTTSMLKGDATDNEAVLCNTPGGSGHGVLLHEAIIYSAALTDTEVQQVQQYLLAKHDHFLAVGSLNELGTGIPGPGVARYAQNRTVVEAINSVASPPFNYADLLAWYDAPQIEQLTGESDGDSLAVWKSSAGAAGVELDASQPTVANQPIYRNPGVGALPTVGFTGTIDSATSKRLQLASGLEAVLNVTFFAVFRHKQTPSNASLGSGILTSCKDSSGTNMPFWFGVSSADKILYNHGSGGNFFHQVGSTTLAKDKYHIASIRRTIGTGRNVTVRVDGVEEINANPTFDPASTAGVEGWMGNGVPTGGDAFNYPLIGDIAEILYYDRVLDDTETLDIERYLLRKWGPHIKIGDLADLSTPKNTLVAAIG